MNPNTTQSFTLRSYGFGELAILYNPQQQPKSAARQLKRWINCYPGLTERLSLLGYTSGQRILTPKQVACIVECLGEP